MSFDPEDTVTLAEVEVLYETDKAFLIQYDEEKLWVPKSVIHADSEVYEAGDKGYLVVAHYWARKQGLD